MKARIAAAVLLLASAACVRPEPAGLSPHLTRALRVPAVGESAAAVAAANGEPDRRERVDGSELWIYTRLAPAVPGESRPAESVDVPPLRLHAAIVRLRGGVVIDVRTTTSEFVPVPTFPAATAR